MADIDEYLKGILGQILDSYKILAELNDGPGDLETIKKELSKIRGLLQVLRSKLGEKKHQSDHLVTLYKLSIYYIDTYDFTREIENLSQIYFNDSNRLKNLAKFYCYLDPTFLNFLNGDVNYQLFWELLMNI